MIYNATYNWGAHIVGDLEYLTYDSGTIYHIGIYSK